MNPFDLFRNIPGRTWNEKGPHDLVIGKTGGEIRIGSSLDSLEKTVNKHILVYNHMAQGGRLRPTGQWIGFQEIPNTVSKVKSMTAHVETPLQQRFAGHVGQLARAVAAMGGVDETAAVGSADLVVSLRPLPRVPVRLFFWDEDPSDGFDARAKLVFDETVSEHLDIESLLFLSERIAQMLCGERGPANRDHTHNTRKHRFR